MRGIAIAVLVACIGTTSARAQTPQEQADKLFAEGRELLVKNDNAKAACEKFEAAIALDPTAPGVMLNLGLCYEKLRKYATSLYWFRKAQAAATEGKLDEYEQAAKEHTTDLATKVPIGKIDVSKAPADVEVSIEGRRVLPSEYARVELDEGPNRIDARARGKKPFQKLVEVTSREAGTISIELEAEVEYISVDAGASRRKIAYVAGGVGIGLWLVTTVYGFVKRRDYFDEPDEDKAEDIKRDVKIYGTTMFALGTAAAIASVVLYLTAPGIERREVKTALTPVITDDQVGVSLLRRF